jgi:trk system potassium uptake protein TrkH
MAPIDDAEPLGRELANWLFPVYLAIILISFLLIKYQGMQTPNGVRALFAAINAATLTGFRQSPGLSSLNNFGQSVILLLVVVGSLFTMIVGGLAVKRIARLRFRDIQIIETALIVEGFLLLLGALLPRDADQSILSTMLLTVGAFGNSGLYLGSVASPSSLLTHLLILPLTILGGLGLPVLMEFGSAMFAVRTISSHSRMALSMSAWVYVIGFLSLFGLQAHHLTSDSISQAAQTSSVLAVESRTGGLPIVALNQTSHATQWAVIVLMAIGASSAGTAGGLKVTTLAELIRGVSGLLAGRPARRAMGIALVWLGVYLGMVIGAVILLASVNSSNDGDGLLFNAVSAVSNVGLSLSEIPDEQHCMFAYCAIMLLGRMTPLMILWWMADSTGDAEWAVG